MSTYSAPRNSLCYYRDSSETLLASKWAYKGCAICLILCCKLPAQNKHTPQNNPGLRTVIHVPCYSPSHLFGLLWKNSMLVQLHGSASVSLKLPQSTLAEYLWYLKTGSNCSALHICENQLLARLLKACCASLCSGQYSLWCPEPDSMYMVKFQFSFVARAAVSKLYAGPGKGGTASAHFT